MISINESTVEIKGPAMDCLTEITIGTAAVLEKFIDGGMPEHQVMELYLHGLAKAMNIKDLEKEVKQDEPASVKSLMKQFKEGE